MGSSERSSERPESSPERGRAVLRGGRGQRGQSMAELALVLPLFLVLVFAVIEIGRAYAVKQALTIAAREGARVLVLPYGASLQYLSEGDVKAAAVARARSYLASAGVPIGNETVIRVARVIAGNDGQYGTADDIGPQFDYIQGVRGQRVGMLIAHRFETPIPLLLKMFDGSAPPPAGGTENGISMGATCYMEHE